MSFPRSPSARAILLAVALALALPAPYPVAPRAVAQPTTPATTSPFSPFTTGPVSLHSTATAVPSDGAFAYAVSVRLAQPATYLQVRFRVRRPSGRLLYQRTLVRTNVGVGTQDFSFQRDLADLALRPDIYPVELTVVAEGPSKRSWKVGGSLRVFDPDASALPVALIVRVTSAPSVDPEGRFVIDPSTETRARDEVVRLSDAVLATPRLKASLAVPAELVEEWQRIAEGYELLGAAGAQSVAADATAPRAYKAAISKLKSALATGRLELVNVPYADPDVAGLVQAMRLRDLRAHLSRSTAVYAATLEETPSAGTFTARGCMIAAAAREVVARKIGYSIASSAYVRTGDATSPPGVFALEETPLVLLVPDANAGRAIGVGDADAAANALFEAAIATGDDRATGLPVVIDVGPGQEASVGELTGGIAGFLGEPWLTFRTADEIAKTPRQSSAKLATRASVSTNTPADWWASVASARIQAEALVSALPHGTPTADAAAAGSLIAESANWAGPDGRWALADSARAFVSATDRLANSVFDKVAIVAQDITLSGPSGSVPVSVTNGGDASLAVTLRAIPTGVRLKGGQSRKVTLLPAENYLTVPVDLRSSTGGTLKLELLAGSLVVASETVRVRASYLDRLVTIALIALVLGVMLFYIQRRVKRAARSVDGR